jgi:hypothetical protein
MAACVTEAIADAEWEATLGMLGERAAQEATVGADAGYDCARFMEGAMTCCVFSSLKTLLTTEGKPQVRFNVLSAAPVAAFQTSIIGRFCVSTEGDCRALNGCRARRARFPQPLCKTHRPFHGDIDQHHRNHAQKFKRRYVPTLDVDFW